MSTNQGFPKASVGSSSRTAGTAQDARRERRLPVAIRVKVFPDVESPESHACVTYEISTFGARLVAPSGVSVEGQIVYVQRHSRRAKYKVIWIGKPGTRHADQVGVECMEPNNIIWEQDIRTRLQQASFVESTE
ncbi:MAG TPA: PilZ domain-containing protein [Candidatus Angelobacter sp.]|nr:PilZ domain-containing protein [Candidatus Angelobacter sp.]